MMSVSIRSRLLLLVLAVLLPAAAAALLIVGQTYKAEREAVERNLRDTTRALSTVVDHELALRASLARVLAQSSLLDNAPDIGPPDLAALAEEANRALEGLDGWVVLSAPDRELLNTGPAPGTRGTPAAASAAPPPQPRPLTNEPMVRAIEPGSGGRLRATAVHPVKRDGRTVLNLAVTILPEELQRIVDNHRLPPGWVAAVLDSQGQVVARFPGGTAYAGRPVTPDVKALMQQHAEAQFDSVTLDGVPVLAYFSTSPRGWTYITGTPRPDLAGLPPTVVKTGIGALLLLALAMGGALWVARRIAGPVESLKQAAVHLRSGQPVTRRPTGLVECDHVVDALADAAAVVRDARDDLEHQVADAVERTRVTAQRASQSQRVEALGRLTGGVAHDFNNLLGVISNSAHMIQRHAHTPDLQSAVAATLRAVDVGSRLTGHLLRFAGRQPVRPQAVTPRLYLSESEELLKTVLGKRIQLSVSVAPETDRVLVDVSELELALINLALNASDAMPSGGQVWLHARNASDDEAAGLAPGPYVLITLSDNGVGIADDVAERAFEPFFTTKAVGKGTGLGLSQVHGFCAQAGGTARLASTPGLGTTVSMVLPAMQGDGTTASAGPVVNELSDLAGRSVLLVEDNDELGDGTAALLKENGCDVRRARSADEALRLLDAGPDVDVILSDIVMPGTMDGVALARIVRERWPRLPVVLISGYSSALAQAGDDFEVLRKPCPPDELMRALRRALGGTADILR